MVNKMHLANVNANFFKTTALGATLESRMSGKRKQDESQVLRVREAFREKA